MHVRRATGCPESGIRLSNVLATITTPTKVTAKLTGVIVILEPDASHSNRTWMCREDILSPTNATGSDACSIVALGGMMRILHLLFNEANILFYSHASAVDAV